IYNNGSEEVIRRGKKIYATSGVELIDFDDLVGNVVFRVKDDNYATYYKVHIQQFKNPKLLGLRCTCPYNLSEICRHKAAAIFTLQDMLDKNMLGNKNQVYDQRHTVVKMKLLDLKMIKMLCSSESFSAAEEFLRTQTPTIVAAKDEKVTAKFTMHGSEFTVVIHKNEERNFDTSCNCSGEENHPLCVHKTIVFLHLLQKKGANYFDSIRNWDAVKNKLLGIYGYSLSDDLTGKFEFTYNDGKPFLRVLDTSIKRVATPQAAEPKPQLAIIEKQALPEEVNELPTENAIPNKAALKLGVVISAQSLQYPFLQIDAIQGETDDLNEKYVSKIEKLDLNKFINTEVFSEEDKAIVQLLRKFLPSEVDKYLSRNSPFSGFWENIVHYPSEGTLPPETLALIDEYLLPKFQRLFTELHDSKFCFFLPERKTFNSANLLPIECSNWQISPEFEINYRNNLYTIACFVKLPHIQIPIAENECGSFLAFQYKGQFFCWQKPEDLQTIAPFLPTGKIQITPADWSNSLHSLILPLSNQYPISFGNLQKEELKDIVPEQTIWLKEKGEYLVFEIDFLYKGKSIQKSEREKLIVPAEEKLWIIHRNFEAEKTFLQYLENLHSNFIRTGENYVLALKGTDVLKNNWFFLFVDAMKDKNITVYGFEALKTFRFNTAKPSTKIFISSNTDWFDAKIQIQFGEQQVTVEDIKKALSNKQQYVPLQDGTLGILPEEWIKKYALLFKIAEGKAADMKVSRFHFSVIEDIKKALSNKQQYVPLQ
ncbi:MAG: SNF2 helicase associated domain-containing protein, partial [Chitinophagaceae bacterium]